MSAKEEQNLEHTFIQGQEKEGKTGNEQGSGKEEEAVPGAQGSWRF